MEQYALYLYLKSIINNLGYKFKITFNDYDINGSNIVGILFKSGPSPKYRELNTGKYYGNTSRVQILVQSGTSKDSILKSLDLVSKLREILTTSIINNKYTITSSEVGQNSDQFSSQFNLDENNESDDLGYVLVTDVHLIGDVDFKGKTSQARSIYSLNLLINYYYTYGGN